MLFWASPGPQGRLTDWRFPSAPKTRMIFLPPVFSFKTFQLKSQRKGPVNLPSEPPVITMLSCLRVHWL